MAEINDVQSMLNALGRAAGNVADQLNKLDQEARYAMTSGHFGNEHRGSASDRAFKLKQDMASKTLNSFAKSVKEAQESLKTQSANYKEIDRIITAQRVVIGNNLTKLYKSWDQLSVEYPKQVQESINKTINSSSSFVSGIIQDFNVTNVEAALTLEDLTTTLSGAIKKIKSGRVFDVADEMTNISTDLVKNIHNLTLAQFDAIANELRSIDSDVGDVAANILREVKQTNTLTEEQAKTLRFSMESLTTLSPDIVSNLQNAVTGMVGSLNNSTERLTVQLGSITDHISTVSTTHSSILDSIIESGTKLDAQFSDKLLNIFKLSSLTDAEKLRAETLYLKHINAVNTGIHLNAAEQAEISKLLKDVTPQLNDLLSGLIDINTQTMNAYSTELGSIRQRLKESLSNELGGISSVLSGNNRMQAINTLLETTISNSIIKLGKAMIAMTDSYLDQYKKQAASGIQAFNPVKQVSTFLDTVMNPADVQDMMIANKDYATALSKDYKEISKRNGEFDSSLSDFDQSTKQYVNIIRDHNQEVLKMAGYDWKTAGEFSAEIGRMAVLTGNRGVDLDAAITKNTKSFSNSAKLLQIAPKELLQHMSDVISDSDVQSVLLTLSEKERKSYIDNIQARMLESKEIFGSTEAAKKFQIAIGKSVAKLTPIDRMQELAAMPLILKNFVSVAEKYGAEKINIDQIREVFVRGVDNLKDMPANLQENFAKFVEAYRILQTEGSRDKPQEKMDIQRVLYGQLEPMLPNLTRSLSAAADTYDALQRREVGASAEQASSQVAKQLKDIDANESKLADTINKLTSWLSSASSTPAGEMVKGVGMIATGYAIKSALPKIGSMVRGATSTPGPGTPPMGPPAPAAPAAAPAAGATSSINKIVESINKRLAKVPIGQTASKFALGLGTLYSFYKYESERLDNLNKFATKVKAKRQKEEAEKLTEPVREKPKEVVPSVVEPVREKPKEVLPSVVEPVREKPKEMVPPVVEPVREKPKEVVPPVIAGLLGDRFLFDSIAKHELNTNKTFEQFDKTILEVSNILGKNTANMTSQLYNILPPRSKIEGIDKVVKTTINMPTNMMGDIKFNEEILTSISDNIKSLNTSADINLNKLIKAVVEFKQLYDDEISNDISPFSIPLTRRVPDSTNPYR